MIPASALRTMPCGHCGGEDPDCKGMTLAGRCHPNAGTKVLYKSVTHSLHISCIKCGKLVVEIALTEHRSAVLQ